VSGVDEYLKIKMDEIRKYHPEIEYIERNTQPDHVHIVVSVPPKYSIAQGGTADEAEHEEGVTGEV